MAITANSLANIYASLDAYLAAHLLFPDGSPISLRLHGVRRFVPPVDAPWVEVHYDFLALQSDFRNRLNTRGGMPQLATERAGYLQLNAYQRARRFATRYTTAAIRDAVIGAFPEGELVPVLDYDATNAPPTLEQEGWIVVDESTENVVDTGMLSGIVQHVVRIRTRYLELFTRSV